MRVIVFFVIRLEAGCNTGLNLGDPRFHSLDLLDELRLRIIHLLGKPLFTVV